MLKKAIYEPPIQEKHVVLLRFNNFELEFESSYDAVLFIKQYLQEQDQPEVNDDYQVL